MSIIRTIDQPITPPGYAGRLQELGFQPLRAYREILARDVDMGGGVHRAVPYQFAVPATQAVTVAIPHGLNGDANGVDFDAHTRIPDVVLPVRVHLINDAAPDLGAGVDLMLASDGNAVPLWASGFYADKDFVYITLLNWGVGEALVRFYVVIEYTHSAVRNEFYTATQGTATVYTEELAPQ